MGVPQWNAESSPCQLQLRDRWAPTAQILDKCRSLVSSAVLAVFATGSFSVFAPIPNVFDFVLNRAGAVSGSLLRRFDEDKRES
jgi:hypothetical protein